MNNGELPTREDCYRISIALKDIFGNQEFFLFQLDWGAARITDLIDDERERVGLHYIRYDLPLGSYSKGGLFRPVPKQGATVRHNLEHGKTLINAVKGPLYVPIEPVDFNFERYAVMFEDWLGYTGQGLIGGVVWGIDNRKQLNIKKIYPAVMKAFRKFELPEGYNHYNSLVGELILPYEQYPLTQAYKKTLVGTYD